MMKRILRAAALCTASIATVGGASFRSHRGGLLSFRSPGPEKFDVKSRFAAVNGTKLHHLVAGQGDPVILLHGYAQTSHMWLPLMAELAKTNTVLAPGLRGAGQSAKPEGVGD